MRRATRFIASAARPVGIATLTLTLLLAAAVTVAGNAGVLRLVNVTSGSMQPTFGAGALLLAVPIDGVDVTAGQVIVARELTGETVAHRVTETFTLEDGTPMAYRRGDANAAPDAAPVLLEDVWRVTAHVPHVGPLYAAAVTGVGRYFAAGMVVCAIGLVVVTTPRGRHRA